MNHILKSVMMFLLSVAITPVSMLAAQLAPPLPGYIPALSLSAPEFVPDLHGKDLEAILRLKEQMPKGNDVEDHLAIERLLREAVYCEDKTPVSNAQLFHIVLMQRRYGSYDDAMETLSLINPLPPEGETPQSLRMAVYDLNDKTNWNNEVFLKDMQLKAEAEGCLVGGASDTAAVVASNIISIHERDQVLLNILYRQCYTSRSSGKFNSMIRKAGFTYSKLSENARIKGLEYIKDAYFYAVDMKPTEN